MQQKILVIDDDEKLNQLLQKFLGEFGFKVVTAVRPSQGLKLLKKEQELFLKLSREKSELEEKYRV